MIIFAKVIKIFCPPNMQKYTTQDLEAFGERELIELIIELQERMPKALPCYKCGTLIDIEILDENGAYTYPDGLPFCPDCNPDK